MRLTLRSLMRIEVTMESDLISYEDVLDIIRGWPSEGDKFPPACAKDDVGRPLWDRVVIERFAHKNYGLPI